ASRFRAIALRQHVLHVCVEEFMAPLSQKHKELSSLACACGNFLLFRGQRDRRIPHDGLLTMEGVQDSSIYQSTNLPILSTLYEPLSKQLINVLAEVHFLLTEHRDTEAARRFLKKAIRRHGLPETITIDGSDANEAAIKRYNEEHGTAIAIRQVKYLNNIVEQDHRAVKRIIRSMLGFKSFTAAQDTLVGIELMHMIKKRQMVVEAGEEGLTAAELFYSLAA